MNEYSFSDKNNYPESRKRDEIPRTVEGIDCGDKRQPANPIKFRISTSRQTQHNAKDDEKEGNSCLEPGPRQINVPGEIANNSADMVGKSKVERP